VSKYLPTKKFQPSSYGQNTPNYIEYINCCNNVFKKKILFNLVSVIDQEIFEFGEKIIQGNKLGLTFYN
jgi:hypothetical protein